MSTGSTTTTTQTLAQQRTAALNALKLATEKILAISTPTVFDWSDFMQALVAFLQQIIPLVLLFITGGATPAA